MAKRLISFKRKASTDELEAIEEQLAMYQEMEQKANTERTFRVQDAGKPKVMLPGPEGGGPGAAFYKDLQTGEWVKYRRYSKKAGQPDMRSVKHSVQDATTKAGMRPMAAIAAGWGVYTQLVDYEILTKGLPTGGPWVWVVLLLVAGWWLIAFTIRLAQKSAQVHD